MPHSVFLGADGRWTQDDRDKAIWWMLREAERCPGCGTRPAEWEPAKGGHPNAYTAGGRMCPGCFHVETAREKWQGKAGVHVVLNPRTGDAADARP